MFLNNFIEKERLLDLLTSSACIEEDIAEKIIIEILEFFSETEKEFIKRKHKELRELGYKTDKIYNIINSKIENYLFKGNKFSKRKYKRIIYGD